LGWLNKQGAVGKGVWPEQIFSLLVTLLVVLFFSFKKIASRSWELVGKYSYEIYLLHWPIYWRYQILYQYLPAWLATALYLLLIVVLAIGLHKLLNGCSIKLK
jgi:peptidoglycan/LPS O-acetylase OafA/YrhL